MKQRDDKRNTIDDTPQMVQCSVSHNSLRGWYRFVTAVGTRTPTTCDDSYKCDKANPGWLTF